MYMKKGYFGNIENDTLANDDYRRVLYTAKHMQLVVMSVKPREEIGEEIHEVDQFLRFESGEGKVIINEMEYNVKNGSAVVIPAGSKHNVINTGDEELQIYTLYAPPEHKDKTRHPTKADEQEEHFDGKTTE